MAIHHRMHMHGHKVAVKKHKNAGITVHGKPGAHGHKFEVPGIAKQDAWKRQAEAQNQG